MRTIAMNNDEPAGCTEATVSGDRYLDSDAVFGVRQSLIADWLPQPGGSFLVAYDFVLNPA